MFLKESKEAFKKALFHCQEDVMWQGFIHYNDARSSFFLQVLTGEDSEGNWGTLMEAAIAARSKLTVLVSEVLKNKPISHMQSFFLYQEELARLIKLNIQIAEKECAQGDEFELIYKGIDLSKVESAEALQAYFYSQDQFTKISHYQGQITNHISEDD